MAVDAMAFFYKFTLREISMIPASQSIKMKLPGFLCELLRWMWVAALMGLLSCKSHPASESALDQNLSPAAIIKDTSAEVAFEDFDSLVRQYEDPERKNWQSPELVLEKMGDLSGKTVADIGVGTGYFAFRLIQRGAHVIGIDVDKRFLDYIEDRKAELDPGVAARLKTRLTKPENPELNINEVDWILIVNTYHFLRNRVDYLKKLFSALKPGGKIMIVDYKKGYTPVGPVESEKVPAETTVNELKSSGFLLLDRDDKSLQYQYIIRARKP